MHTRREETRESLAGNRKGILRPWISSTPLNVTRDSLINSRRDSNEIIEYTNLLDIYTRV